MATLHQIRTEPHLPHIVGPRLVSRDRRSDLLRQSAAARSLGNPFVAEVLAAAFRQLHHAPHLEALIARWPHDPASSAMALRLNAGLHALARRECCSDLAALYDGRHIRFDRTIGQVLAKEQATLLQWMDHPTQTNEACRSSAVMAALMVLADIHPMPVELFEIGASAGLNLLLDRYGHTLGDVFAGDRHSSLQLKPEWEGPSPPQAPVRIASAKGVDLRPMRLDDPLTRERLQSYVWPGENARAHVLAQAITIARQDPPEIAQASAATWLGECLGAPTKPGRARVVLHSMVMQYLPETERKAMAESISRAAGQASREAPLAQVGFEWCAQRSDVYLTLTIWDGQSESGKCRVLATCHPYGAAIAFGG